MTEFFIGGRRAGKTARAIEWAKANDGVLIVVTESERRRIESDEPELRGRVIPWPLARERLRGLHKPYAVDNAELVLQAWLGAEPALITGTGD